MISKKKKVKHVVVHTRKSERITNLKIKNIMGSGKHLEDPIVIIEEDTSIGPSKSARIMKNSDEIH